MEYKIQLTEQKVKQQQVTALHLISALAFLGAGIIIFRYNYDIPYWGLALLIVSLGLLVLTIAKNKLVTKPANNTFFRLGEMAVALILLLYSVHEQWKFPMGMFGILSVVLAFAAVWERRANAAQFVVFDEEGIALPSGSRRRFLEWEGINEVLLRYGTLSIDCLDNYLYQWTIEQPSFSKDAFESFCAKQVEANISKRKGDDW